MSGNISDSPDRKVDRCFRGPPTARALSAVRCRCALAPLRRCAVRTGESYGSSHRIEPAGRTIRPFRSRTSRSTATQAPSEPPANELARSPLTKNQKITHKRVVSFPKPTTMSNQIETMLANAKAVVETSLAPILAQMGVPNALAFPLTVCLLTVALTIYLFSVLSKTGSKKSSGKKSRTSAR